MTDEYMLEAVAAEESALFYSSQESGRDLDTGCIGHMRFDFGRDGKGFYSSWENHCVSLKTQAFKDEFDKVVNHLRDNGIFKSRDVMQSHCYNSPQTKLNDGREYNHGFRIKTDDHVYYLRCSTLSNDYSYIYAYERSRLEKCFPSLADTIMSGELRSKLETAAAFIVEKSARETTSCNYIISADDIPADVLSPELFGNHVADIADMMLAYKAVAGVEVNEDGDIDTIMYLDYCPGFEPGSDERDKYPENRKILDPLASKQFKEETPTKQSASKPSLLETLERNKQKAARQGQTNTRKSSELEV